MRRTSVRCALQPWNSPFRALGGGCRNEFGADTFAIVAVSASAHVADTMVASLHAAGTNVIVFHVAIDTVIAWALVLSVPLPW